jgi:hypothetical protein
MRLDSEVIDWLKADGRGNRNFSQNCRVPYARGTWRLETGKGCAMRVRAARGLPRGFV